MQIVDLTTRFPANVENANAIKEYERLCAPLFKHYNKYWSVSDYPYCHMEPDPKRESALLLEVSLRKSCKSLSQIGLDISRLRAILMVGKGTSNGHAWFDDQNWVVWFPVETYTTALRRDVFILHEIAHALHYEAVNDFYFETMTAKEDLMRLLITEGLATYVSMKAGGFDELTALWADYLTEEEARGWYDQCRQQYPRLCDRLLRGLSDHENLAHYFRADNPADIEHFRAGYFVGLQVIKAISEKQGAGVSDLLTIPREQFERLALEQLRSIASKVN